MNSNLIGITILGYWMLGLGSRIESVENKLYVSILENRLFNSAPKSNSGRTSGFRALKQASKKSYLLDSGSSAKPDPVTRKIRKI